MAVGLDQQRPGLRRRTRRRRRGVPVLDRHTKVSEAKTHLWLALNAFCLAVVIDPRARGPGEQHWDSEVLVEEGCLGVETRERRGGRRS